MKFLKQFCMRIKKRLTFRNRVFFSLLELHGRMIQHFNVTGLERKNNTLDFKDNFFFRNHQRLEKLYFKK